MSDLEFINALREYYDKNRKFTRFHIHHNAGFYETSFIHKAIDALERKLILCVLSGDTMSKLERFAAIILIDSLPKNKDP